MAPKSIMPIRDTRRPSRSRGGVREDTKGQSAHLHAGPPLEDEGGPRADVCVPRDGRVCSCFVSGGAGEDFGRGGRGKQIGQKVFDARWARWNIVACASKAITASWHARSWACWKTHVGRRRRLDSGNGGKPAWWWFIIRRTIRMRCPCTRLSCLEAASGPPRILPHINLATTYRNLGRRERALQIERDVYSAFLRLRGEEHRNTHAAP